MQEKHMNVLLENCLGWSNPLVEKSAADWYDNDAWLQIVFAQ